MEELWLWSDGIPGEEEIGYYGIFEFKITKERITSTAECDIAEVTKILFISPGCDEDYDIKVGFRDTIYNDAITDNPKMIIKFLFDQVFY